ncbi:unnamed protein product [Closterium sp. NIES-53]
MPGWQFYHPTSRRVLPSQDVSFDESVPFYRLFPYRTAPLPTPPLFLTPGLPPVDPLPPQGPGPSGVSQVDPLLGTVPVKVAVDSGAARSAASWGAEPTSAEPGGAEPAGAEPEGAESGGIVPGGVEPGGTEPEGAELGGAESEGVESRGDEPRGTASAGGPAAAGAGGSIAGGTGAGGTGATSMEVLELLVPEVHLLVVLELPGLVVLEAVELEELELETLALEMLEVEVLLSVCVHACLHGMFRDPSWLGTVWHCSTSLNLDSWEPLGAVSTMAGPEERGGRGAGGSGEAQAQGQPRDSAMAPVQPSLGQPRDEPGVFGLDKFNGNNFAEWSFRMEYVFDHYDLQEVMEGTEKRPENDPEKSPWVRKSAQGYLLLGQALGSSQICHIKPFQREPEKGPKAWAALKGVHAPATAAEAVVLERQMAALRIEEDEAVEEGVQKFFDLLTRLEGADLNYSELQKKTKLLALLPDSWSSLIINHNRDLPRLSLEDVKRAILQEDFRRRQEGRGAGEGRGRGHGGRGGRRGGAASMKSAGNESKSRDDRFPGQFFFVSTQASAGPEKDEGFEEPAAVGKVTLHSLDYWVIDSGATYSMTPRADLLTELEPSPVKHVTSALGQRAEVKGMGKAMFKGADGKMSSEKNLSCMWVLDEVVMDVVGPLKLGAAGAEYFLTIVDVYTRMTWVYVLSKKSDLTETVKTDWLPMVERQQDRLVKAIRTDRGGEFLSKEFSLWLKKNGIRHSLTMPYFPVMNGIAERANRTITETARGLLIEAGLPEYFWPDAVRSVCVAKNRALTHVGAEKWVPYVEWVGRKPKVDMLQVFGCMCMALVPKHLRHNKLGAKAISAVHLGMAQNSKGWLLSDPFTKKFLVSRDCIFMENLMYKDWKAENEAKIGMRFGEVKSSGLEHVELPLELSSSSTTTRKSSVVNGGEEAKDAEEEEEDVQQVSERAPTLPSRTTSAPRIRVTPQQRQGLHVPAAEEEGRGKRRIQALSRLTYEALGKPAKLALAGAALIVGDDEESDYDECAFAFFSPVEMPGEPETLKEALESSDAEDWKKAMESELTSIEENDTWELVELLKGRKAFTSKWLFKIKSDADGKGVPAKGEGGL